ncbi:MAG: CYTH domain-containing protein [bacterium]|nr:CYTH domain-containing protein [bacterium]
MKTIEVEIRSFIPENQWDDLLDFFHTHATLIKEDFQETYYFDCAEDLRIQKNEYYAKIWLKKGKLHDEAREEIEIHFDKNDFNKLETIFSLAGLPVKIKWFRKRYEFQWGDITVCIDDTKGYGRIIELEKMANEEEKESVITELKEAFNTLHLKQTPLDEFKKRFAYYEKHWRELVAIEN